MRENQLHSII